MSSAPATSAASTPTSFQGRPAVRLTLPDGASAVVLLHGAQAVSWTTADGVERLYLSGQAVHAEGQAVRGGVPVIFPQFECRGPLPRHGLVRQRSWSLLATDARDDDALVCLGLNDDAQTRAVWPVAFEVELTVRLGRDRLDIELAVNNTHDSEWPFTAALHTYLRAADIESVRLTGLQRLRYEDSVRGTEQVDTAPSVAIEGEIDRIYFDVALPLDVTGLADDGSWLHVEASGFRDAVLWNPGPTKAAALADMPSQDHRHMVCVEAACVGTPVVLAPGEEWVGRQSLSVLRFEADN